MAQQSEDAGLVAQAQGDVPDVLDVGVEHLEGHLTHEATLAEQFGAVDRSETALPEGSEDSIAPSGVALAHVGAV